MQACKARNAPLQEGCARAAAALLQAAAADPEGRLAKTCTAGNSMPCAELCAALGGFLGDAMAGKGGVRSAAKAAFVAYRGVAPVAACALLAAVKDHTARKRLATAGF